MDISIIIVNYRSSEHLGRCLRSIFSGFLPVPFEIIVVNNDTPEAGSEIAAAFGGQIVFIQNPRNLGFAEANNIAILKAKGRYVLLLNPDTVVGTDAIWRLYGFLEQNGDYGAAGPKIFLPDGSIQLEGGRNFPSLKYALWEIFLLRRVRPDEFGGYRLEKWDHDSNRDVPCLLGAAIMVPRSLLGEIGTLDTSLPMYLEDIDLCYRIRLTGKRIHYLSDASIIHMSGQSSAGTSPSARASLHIMELCQAVYLFFKKHNGVLYAWAYRMIVFFGSLFRILIIPFLLSLGKIRPVDPGRLSVYTWHKYIGFLKWSVTLKTGSLD